MTDTAVELESVEPVEKDLSGPPVPVSDEQLVAMLVEPEVVVEIEVDQDRLEFGRYRHRPRVRRVRGDLTPDLIDDGT